MGGENAHPFVPYTNDGGSSPRGRGKQAPGHARYHSPGLIPAWAGKTQTYPSPHYHSWAHPRVGGENTCTPRPFDPCTGSSPRGRGKPHRKPENTLRGGLIPAWAGKTGCRRSAPWRRRAHPRVGGENAPIVSVLPFSQGSSPRGRGKRGRRGLVGLGEGLIPAWAGKTTKASSSASTPRAHPRVGGENKLALCIVRDV